MCSRCWSRSPRTASRCSSSLRTSRAKRWPPWSSTSCGARRKAMLQDIANLTGGKAITEDLGIKLENVQMADLGQAKKITVDKDNTTLVEGKGKHSEIEGRIKEIRSQVDKTTSDY